MNSASAVAIADDQGCTFAEVFSSR